MPLHFSDASPGSVFAESEVLYALMSLEIQNLNPAVQVGIDLHALLEGEGIVPPPQGMPKGYGLERSLVRLICDVYHRTPQLILGGSTPMEAFDDAFADLDERNASPSLKELREAVGREIEAVIGEEGLLVEGELYNSEWLQTVRNMAGEQSVKVRFDPLAMGEISVLPRYESVALLAKWMNWQVVPSVAGVSLTRTLQELREVGEEMSDAVPVREARRTNCQPLRDGSLTR